jgi:transposase
MRLRRRSKSHYAVCAAAMYHHPTFISRLGANWAAFYGALDKRALIGIMHITLHGRLRLAETPRYEKAAALRRHHALNPRARAVSDSAFTSSNDFFDARDLVQVKYEMLRRVNEDGQPVTQAAADFGFSRPSFYQAQAVFEAEGLPGLVPQRPGPKRAHKLSEEVVDRLEQALKTDPSLNSAQLAQRLEEELGLRVHRRSVERALSRRLKKGAPRRP